MDIKSSTEVAKETGLSKERVNQFARVIGVSKLANCFVWTEEQIAELKSRIGLRGHRL